MILSNFKFVRKFRCVALNTKSHKNGHNKVKKKNCCIFSSNYTIVNYNQPFKTVLTVEMSMLHLTPYPDWDVPNTSHCVLGCWFRYQNHCLITYWKLNFNLRHVSPILDKCWNINKISATKRLQENGSNKEAITKWL